MMNAEFIWNKTKTTRAERDELIERISDVIGEDGSIEVLPGLHLNRRSAPTVLAHGITQVAFCVIAQGSKEILLGSNRLRYDPAHYLLGTVELPVTSHIVEASQSRPYLGLRLELDPLLVSSVVVEAGHTSARNAASVSALAVSRLDVNLREAAVRLLRLIDTPAEASFLMPLITREIIYRLLMSDEGGQLRHLVRGSHTHRMAQAIERLRMTFDQPLRIDAIAHELGMSVSSFHHHFKAVTAMSPLQFQKRLRLQEARRLMIGEGLDAAGAAFQVGYHDAAYFNRDYKSLFGLPPMRDVARMRGSC